MTPKMVCARPLNYLLSELERQHSAQRLHIFSKRSLGGIVYFFELLAYIYRRNICVGK